MSDTKLPPKDAPKPTPALELNIQETQTIQQALDLLTKTQGLACLAHVYPLSLKISQFENSELKE